MRTLGVAVLGIFAGLAVGFTVFSELLGRLVVDNGEVEAPWTFVIGFGPQLTAVVGGILAVVIDNRVRRRQERQ
ncbi:hypothetical protein B1813_21820 [Saccharomonospora piscinae]|uniref:Uncharacterized protein n=1 Tax=Saccharomonospora piscinae TaxID=687388 RepID=A0A1V8ZXD8_SACPI|nr:DUF5957 family protein [Saccharomonospora piscinae]OQO89565.1 hypothetical protein B1813_21820 [Saccharomonospora piscinae]TLW91253.1 hypothetical protein FFT09_18530 [Saccharomonospora piscinae]